jgi:hypothetical protein
VSHPWYSLAFIKFGHNIGSNKGKKQLTVDSLYILRKLGSQTMDIVDMTIIQLFVKNLTFMEIVTSEIPKSYTLYKCRQKIYVIKIIYQRSAVLFSEQMTDPPPLELT